MNWGNRFFARFGRKEKDRGTTLRLEKRRGKRVPAAMPVFVYGRAHGEPFSELSETANVSPQGGLVALSVELQPSQTLLVTNLTTNEDLACRVARLAKTEKGKTLVAVEFLRPLPTFWSIDFSSRRPDER